MTRKARSPTNDRGGHASAYPSPHVRRVQGDHVRFWREDAGRVGLQSVIKRSWMPRPRGANERGIRADENVHARARTCEESEQRQT